MRTGQTRKLAVWSTSHVIYIMSCDVVARETSGTDSSGCTVCTMEGTGLALTGCSIENRSSDTRLAKNGKEGEVSIAACNSRSTLIASYINKSRIASSTFSIGFANGAIFRAIHGYFATSSIDNLIARITKSAVSLSVARSAEG